MAYYSRKVITHEGIGFRSRDEIRFYEYLKKELREGRIRGFEYEADAFELMPKFKLGDENIRAITYTPDFIVYEMDKTTTYYEVKGHLTEQAKIKVKLFKYWLYQNEPKSQYKMVVRNLKHSTIGGEFIEYGEYQKILRANRKNK